MSYHDDDTSSNDLYRICNNNENDVDVQDNHQGQYSEGKKLFWPASPIIVSIVTPKSLQSTTANGPLSFAKVITSGASNNIYCGKDVQLPNTPSVATS